MLPPVNYGLASAGFRRKNKIANAACVPGAVRITGTYTVEGDKVRVKVYLRQDGKTIATLPEIFTMKEKISNELLNAVRTELSKIPINMKKATKRNLLILCGVFWLTGLHQVTLGQKPELIVQTGHSASVLSVAFSPDGKIIASASNDKTIKLWDAVTGIEIRTLVGKNSDWINSVVFSPDSKIIASASNDKTIKLWNVTTGAEIRTLVGHSESVRSVAFSPDGKTIASASGGKMIKLWNVASGVLVGTLIGHSGNFYVNNVQYNFHYGFSSVTFSPDGKTIAGASTDGIILWNVTTRGEVKTLNGHFFDSSIAFSPDSKMIASASGDFTSKDNTINLWSVESGAQVRTFIGHSKSVGSVTFSPDGKTIASASWDNTVKLWDTTTGAEMRTLNEHSGIVNSVAFSPNGKMIASANNDGTVKLWDVSLGVKIRTLAGHSSSINSVTFSADGKIIASASEDRTIKLWNTAAGTDIKTLTVHDDWIPQIMFSPTGERIASPPRLPDWIRSIAFSPDSKMLVSTYCGGTTETIGMIKLWNVATGEEIKTLTGHSNIVRSVAFSSDGKMLVSVSEDKTIKLWSIESRAEIRTLAGHLGIVNSAIFSPDGKIIASASEDKTIKLWNVITGAEIRTLAGHSASVRSVAFSPDGKTIASASEDSKIKLWDITTGAEVRTFIDRSSDLINSVIFSPGNRMIASASGGYTGGKDNTINLWNVESGAPVRAFIGHSNSVRSIAFSPDGKTIVSGSADLTTKIWDVATGNELASLIAIDGKDWLVKTPDGFFDGTPNAWKQLIWRFNNNTFDYAPVETYFNDFFYPNLLQDILNGKSPKAPAGSELEKKDRRQPKVEIVSVNEQTKEQIKAQNLTDKRLATVAVEVTDNTGEKKQPEHERTSGAQDLRLFRNGSLVKVWHDDVFKLSKADNCEQINKPAEPRRVRCLAEVPVVAGENDFTAYAFNLQNVKSGDDSVSVKGADSLKRRGTLYVLAVGVNKYANSAYDLNFAVPDVVDISRAIKSEQDKIANYQKTEVITLTDENATKDNILLALRRFSEGDKAAIPSGAAEKLKGEFGKIKPTQPEDALIIYYAGHGTSNGQRFYLMPHNFTGNDENALKLQGVSDLELNEVLEKVDAGKLLMAIDACQSGQALGAKDEGRAPMNSKGLAQLAYDKGMLILTAAQSQQAALEAVKIGDKEIRHGLLTYALLEGLVIPEADKDGNRQLWEREWLDYAVEQVPNLQLEAMKQRQIEIKQTGRGAELVYVNGDKNDDANNRKVQTPRVFYKREADVNPFVVAKP